MNKDIKITKQIIDILNNNLFDGLLIKCDTCKFSDSNTWGYIVCRCKQREKCIKFDKWQPNNRIKGTIKLIKKLYTDSLKVDADE